MDLISLISIVPDLSLYLSISTYRTCNALSLSSPVLLLGGANISIVRSIRPKVTNLLTCTIREMEPNAFILCYTPYEYVIVNAKRFYSILSNFIERWDFEYTIEHFNKHIEPEIDLSCHNHAMIHGNYLDNYINMDKLNIYPLEEVIRRSKLIGIGQKDIFHLVQTFNLHKTLKPENGKDEYIKFIRTI